MTILIFVLIAFGILNIIHHITMIEQLKEVKRIQYDFLECLGDIDCDMITLNDQLKEINLSFTRALQSIQNR